MHNLFHNALDVAIALREVQCPIFGWSLAQALMGLEYGPTSLTLRSDNTTPRKESDNNVTTAINQRDFKALTQAVTQAYKTKTEPRNIETIKQECTGQINLRSTALLLYKSIAFTFISRCLLLYKIHRIHIHFKYFNLRSTRYYCIQAIASTFISRVYIVHKVAKHTGLPTPRKHQSQTLLLWPLFFTNTEHPLGVCASSSYSSIAPEALLMLAYS